MADDVEMAVTQCFTDTRILCPACSSHRKKSKEKTLSVTIEPNGSKLFYCHHCNVRGCVAAKPYPPIDPLDEFLQTAPGHPNVVELPSATHDRELREFMDARGISENTYKAYNVVTDIRWFNKTDGEQLAVGFVYGDPENGASAVKWRSVRGKAFTQSNAAQTFYGLDNLPEDMNGVPLIICEGELDCLSVTQAFSANDTAVAVLSVPNGAPAKLSYNDDGVKYNYVWEARKLIEQADKIILLTDRDGPGENLKTLLARKIGRGKCWEVAYPDNTKDANDVLCSGENGGEALVEIIEKATPMPLSGVYSPRDYDDKLHELYDKGYGSGVSTGLKTLDPILTIAPGLHVVTGSPSMGKSEFIDQLMLNLSMDHGVSWCVASMENPIPVHLAKLSEKITGKRFFEGPSERMTVQELNGAKDFIEKHFVFLEQRDGNLQTIDGIIDSTKQAIMRFGSSSYGLVIDPYNFVEQRGIDNEHQSISQMLSKLIAFGQAHDLIIFFIAHPTKQYPNQDGEYPIPTGNSISGSASWFSKCDIGLTIHRSDKMQNQPEIHVWKCRFKWIGKTTTGGNPVKLNYDLSNGRFTDIPEKDFDWSIDS